MANLMDTAEKFELLRTRYASQLPERLKGVEAAWNDLATGTWDESVGRTLYRMVHSLAGSGSTFGFDAVSAAARTLEHRLLTVIEQNTPPQDAQRTAINDAVSALQAAVFGANASQFSSILDTNSIAVPDPIPTPDSQLVLLVIDDNDLAQDLVLQIGHFGYTGHVVAHPSELATAISGVPYIAIIVDCKWLTHDQGDGDLSLIQRNEIVIPILFLSSQTDAVARMQAVRAGGVAYFTTPVDITVLVDTLDRLTTQRSINPYRILIVDDDLSVAEHCAHTLQQAGMVTSLVGNPVQTMRVLSEFRPDLVLMDIHMPDYDGLELAAAIRQQEAYVSLPIVFLSTETDVNRRLAAIRLGGDDFLTKPIQDDHLIAAVSSRVERSRILGSFMVRDSLTGLLNHTTTKRYLDIELARAQRQQQPLAVAMIDIDHFKSVNDVYGHPTGDRVIKSLSRLLQQRLRKTDIIGRYGGEEFAIVLPDTDGSSAVRVLDAIRTQFEQIRYQFGGTAFSVTFSCGIASFPTFVDANELSAAADRALYRAKHGGRNHVVLATSMELMNPYRLEDWDEQTEPTRDDERIPISKSHMATRSRKRSAASANDEAAPVVNVLIVDDDPDISRLLQLWLTARGYRVATASTGEEAIEQLEHAALDLLFLDVLMPGMNGLQVLDLIRDQTFDMAVIMTTAHGSEQVAIDSLRRGADDYLRKPISTKEFQAVLERTVTRLQLNRQNAALRRQLDEERRQLAAELARAGEVQANLLPRSYPVIKGFELFARCVPAREVGGDFYDWEELTSGKVTLTLGDVMGKGMPAALLMATTRAAIRGIAHQNTPAVALALAEQALQVDLDIAGSFVTLFHAQLDIETRQLLYVDAGHGHVFMRRANGVVKELERGGMPLGVPFNQGYNESTLVFEPGDTLVLYSDGLVEGRPDPMPTPLMLAAQLQGSDSAQDMVERLIGSAIGMGPLPDDLTVVVLRCNPGHE